MISGFWFWLGICCLTLNLGMLNGDTQWCFLISLWTVIVISYYFPEKILIMVLIIMISSTLWQWREGNLNQQEAISGASIETLAVHQDDITWQDGYLSGQATNRQGNKVQMHGKCPKPPDKQTLTLTAKVQISIIEKKRNQFAFNPQQYWRTKGIVLTYEISENPSWKIRESFAIIDWIKSMHAQCVGWFEHLTPGLRDYGQTLLLGYTRSEFYDDNQGIQKLGLIHLFSISGFQVTLCHKMWFTLARISRFYREDTQIGWFGMLGFIWLFAGGVQSLIRAILASGFSNYCELRHTKLSPVDGWGMVVIGSLWLEPGMCHQLGGQLSFLLSFGLLWLNKAGFWRTNLILNLLIAPSLLAQTYSWQPIGILANLIIIPVFTYVIVPVVFVGVLCSGMQWGDLRDICESIISYTQKTISIGDNIPGEIISGQPDLWWIILLSICTGSVLIYQSVINYGLVMICYMVILCGIGTPSQSFLAFVDVKQGDATIWRTEHKSVYVMDVGGQMMRPTIEQKSISSEQTKLELKTKTTKTGQQLCMVLKGYGIQIIDHLILSHQDVDHIGNFSMLSKSVKIKHIYVPKGMFLTKNFQNKIKPYLQAQTQIHEVLAGDVIGDQNCKVIHPFKSGKGENEDSITVMGKVMGLSYFFSGDLDIAGEHRVLQQTKLHTVDVFKCGHHGSRTSTSEELVHVLNPKLAIVSSSKHNRFKHPHTEVVSRLKKHNILMVNTADRGMIYFEGLKWQSCL